MPISKTTRTRTVRDRYATKIVSHVRVRVRVPVRVLVTLHKSCAKGARAVTVVSNLNCSVSNRTSSAT